MVKYIIVYGTLRMGYGAHHLMEGFEYVGEYETLPHYTLDEGYAYPMVTRGGEDTIKGEVYKVPSEVEMEPLDWYEGVPHLFERSVTEIPGLGDCYLYVYVAGG